MRRLACAVVVLVLGLPGAGVLASGVSPPEVTLAGYLAHLERIRVAIEQLDERRPADVSFVLLDVPRTWTVVTPLRGLDVSADWLRRELTDWRLTPDATTRARIVARIAAVRADAAAYAAPPRNVSGERTRLAAILAAREFTGLHGPTWLDWLRQRAVQWFIAMLGRVLGSSAIPTITNIVIYGLIALVVLIAALWTYRSLQRGAALDIADAGHVAPASRPWTAWLMDARAAASENRWPEAIHLVYWCGISILEDQGAWRPDRSRTPREYLRQLGASHEHRAALQSLTRQAEHVWYGAEPADRSRFDEALEELRKLGCPLA